MAWEIPKIDWKSTDYFNIEDWRRVQNNLIWINNWFKDRGWPNAALEDTTPYRDSMTLPTVELVNRLERNIQKIFNISLIPVTEFRDSKEWHARLSSLYTENPTYDDWNRWEELPVYIKESIDYVSAYLNNRICGTFYAGNNRQLQLFSRGR